MKTILIVEAIGKIVAYIGLIILFMLIMWELTHDG